MGQTLRLAALATTCLWPLAAWAEDGDFDAGFDPGEASAASSEARKPVLVNEMSVGAGYQSGSSAHYGRFTGADREGGFAKGNLRVQSRATEADAGTSYIIVEGENLDIRNSRLLPDSAAGFRVGEQGLWAATLSYDGTPYLASSDYHTLFGSSGELLNGLTPASIHATASNANGVARVNQFLGTTDVGTRRDKIAGGLAYSGLKDWTLSTKLDHEHKQGTKANSVLFMTNARFASITEPVNYDTDRFTASAAYTTRPFQAKLSYTFSSFTNANDEFRVMNPFMPTNDAGAAAAFRANYQGTLYSLPPSNMEHQVKGQFGLNITDATHLATNLRYGLQFQNEGFKARYYEASKVSDNAYDGVVQNLYGNVVLTSRPVKDWNFRAAYTVDDRDNSSPTYRLITYRGDAGTGTFNGGASLRQNVPYSFLNQTGDLELGYRVLKSTKVSALYSYQDKLHDGGVTTRNQENSFGGRVHTTFAPGLAGTLGYTRAIRQATNYNGNTGWNEMNRTGAGIQEADLGHYNYAARNRDELKANLSWGAGEEWSLGATARYVSDRFPNSYYGVTDNHILAAGPDVTYSPTKAVTTHLYYMFQENFTNLLVKSKATAGTGTANGAVWRLDNQDSVHSIGTRTDWRVTDRLKLSFENNLSYGNTAFEEASWWQGAGSATATATAVTLPNSKTVTNSLEVAGEYALYENVFIGLSALWERMLNKDYLNAQQAASSDNQANTAVFAAEGNPGYSIGVLMASARLVW